MPGVRGRGGRPRKPIDLHKLQGTYRANRHTPPPPAKWTASADDLARWTKAATEIEALARRLRIRAARARKGSAALLKTAFRAEQVADRIWARIERCGGPMPSAQHPPPAVTGLDDYRQRRTTK